MSGGAMAGVPAGSTAAVGTAAATFAATLVDEWARAGVRHAVICPGSRSTPLAVALADASRQGRITVHVRLDERSGAFTALGIGLATGRPAVVVTTSGTAAAELHAAVVEAHHAGVPLLACTADRPPELHDIGAPQTIAQRGLFAGAVRWSIDPGVPDVRVAGAWRSWGARMVAEAIAGPRGPGPVHANLPFAEPLTGVAGPLPAGRAAGRSWHTVAPPVSAPGDDLVGTLAAMRARRGLVVAGSGCGPPAAVASLARVLGWPLLADPRSGLRRADLGATVVAAADALVRDARLAAALAPEVVVRLGAPWSSRALAEWLGPGGAAGGADQVLVDPHSAWRDPGRAAGQVAACDPGVLCARVTETIGRDGGPRGANGGGGRQWCATWRRAERAAQGAFDRVLSAHPECTEPGLARRLWRLAGDGTALVVSSSMPVRDLECFAAPRTGSPRVFANRGANGIDGVVSTALGVAAAQAGGGGGRERPIALLGDLALLHDLGALVELTTPLPPATFVVVDNGGGGIFSFLPQAAELDAALFERILGTPSRTEVRAVLEGLGVPAAPLSALGELEGALERARDAPGPSAVLVRTDRDANVAVHAELWEAAAAACMEAL